MMGSEVHRKDERELSLNFELSTGLFPGGKMGVGLKRTWQKRERSFPGKVATAAQVSPDELINAVAESDDFGDLYKDGLDIVIRHGGDAYQDIFAGLVAAALADPASVNAIKLRRLGCSLWVVLGWGVW